MPTEDVRNEGDEWVCCFRGPVHGTDFCSAYDEKGEEQLFPLPPGFMEKRGIVPGELFSWRRRADRAPVVEDFNKLRGGTFLADEEKTVRECWKQLFFNWYTAPIGGGPCCEIGVADDPECDPFQA